MANSSTEVSVDAFEVDSEEMTTEDMETKHMLEEEASFSNSCTECRICQVEDSINEMESPCRCNGTLKFAHRDCIQQWINLSYKATCEICKQPYEGGYTIPVPPPAAPPRQPTRREVLDAIRARRAHVVVDPEAYRARLNAANSAILGRSVVCRIAPVLNSSAGKSHGLTAGSFGQQRTLVNGPDSEVDGLHLLDVGSGPLGSAGLKSNLSFDDSSDLDEPLLKLKKRGQPYESKNQAPSKKKKDISIHVVKPAEIVCPDDKGKSTT